MHDKVTGHNTLTDSTPDKRNALRNKENIVIHKGETISGKNTRLWTQIFW